MGKKMMLKVFLLLQVIGIFCTSLQAGVLDYFKGQRRATPPTILVLVVHDVKGANLQVRGRYSLYDPHENKHMSSRFAGKTRAIEAAPGGLKWGEMFPGLYQLQIDPKDSSTVYAIDDKDFGGTLYIYDIGGTISIVDQISVEDYVRSTMATYQGQNLEAEVLAALAIIARTNAYYLNANPRTKFWTVDGQKVGFNGIVNPNPPTDEAVRQTRFMIMSRTGVYEKVATPFAAQFGDFPTGLPPKELEVSKISVEEANAMAQKGEHAAQILNKAFPGVNIMLMQYSQ